MSKVLIVIDMQNDFVTGGLGSEEARGIIPQVVDKIKEYKAQNSTVVFTRDTHNDNYLDTQEGKFLPVKHCIEGTKGWEIVDEIKVCMEEDSIVINKPTFGSIELANKIRQILSKEDIFNIEETQIELIGVCTDICVVSNALILKAFLPEVELRVDASCCAGVTQEKHKSALETLRSCQVSIIND